MNENLVEAPDSISKTIQLDRPSQVNCAVKASCGPSTATNLTTYLEYPGGTRTLVVSRTMVSPYVANNLRNGTSLFLPAGFYKFTARLASALDGPVPEGDIQSLDLEILADPNFPGRIGAITVAGASEGFFLASSLTERHVEARVQIQCQLEQGQSISSSMLITDTNANPPEIVQTFPSEIAGPNVPALIIQASPYFLKAQRIMKFHYSLSPAPPSNGVCVISALG